MQLDSTPNTEHKLDVKRVFTVFVLVLLAILIIKLIDVVRNGRAGSNTSLAAEVVINDAPKGSLPEGFPREVPVEMREIIDSKTYSYPGYNASLYSFVYLTNATKALKYSEYLLYMRNAGYVFDKKGIDERLGILYGAKDGNDLSVVVSEEGGKTLVQLNYLQAL